MATSTQKKIETRDDEEVSLENLKKSAQWVVMVIAVALLAVSVYQWAVARRDSLHQEVYQAYTTAYTAESLEQVIEAYPDRPEAAAARIQLGAMHYRDGNYEDSLRVHESFLAAHPRHPLLEKAKLGRFLAMEELGRLDEALAGYQTFTPDMLLYPNALFGQARALERLGRLEESLVVYTTIENTFPDSVWALQAEQFRMAAALGLRDRE